MKKILMVVSTIAVAMNVMAIDWTKEALEKFKATPEINFTIDFREAIINGSDSAHFASSLGKEAGWEVGFFNQLRNNMWNDRSKFGKPKDRGKYNMHVIVREVGSNGGMEADGILWTDNIKDATNVKLYTYQGRWNDLDKLMVENSQNSYYTGPLYGFTVSSIEQFIDLKKDRDDIFKEINKQTPKYQKAKAKEYKPNKDMAKVATIKSGSDAIFNQKGLALVECDFSDTKFGERPASESLSELKEMESICAAKFATEFNKKSAGWKVVTDPSVANYKITIKPKHFDRKNLNMYSSADVVICSTDKPNEPLCVYEFEDIENKAINMWVGYIKSNQVNAVELFESLGKLLAGK